MTTKLSDAAQMFVADYAESEYSKTSVSFMVTITSEEDLFADDLGGLSIVSNMNGTVTITGTLALVSRLESMKSVASINNIELITPLETLEDFDAVEEAEEVFPDLDSANWMEKLRKDEIVDVDGKPCPKLCGLRRLAKPFILAEDSTVNKIDMVRKEARRSLNRWKIVPDDNGKPQKVLAGVEEIIGTDFFPYASVTFTVYLQDGRQFTDSADAYLGNCNELGNYPTAVASARAEGRVLRKVLGIAEHVYEEISSKDALEELTSVEDMPIAAEQKKAVENTLNKLEGVTLRDVLENVSATATNLDELSSAEGMAAMKFLNTKKKKGKK